MIQRWDQDGNRSFVYLLTLSIRTFLHQLDYFFLYHFSQYVIFTLLVEQSQVKADSIEVAGSKLNCSMFYCVSLQRSRSTALIARTKLRKKGVHRDRAKESGAECSNSVEALLQEVTLKV